MNVPRTSQSSAMSASDGFTLSASSLAVLMPMHVVLAFDGRVVSLGLTLQQILHSDGQAQPDFLKDFCEILRPRGLVRISDLLDLGAPAKLQLRTAAAEKLTGIACRLADGSGVLLNLSLGFEVVNAVRRYDLTSKNFAPTDLTVEMLYLIEAKSAAQEAQRTLNEKLRTAMSAAEVAAQTDGLTGLANRRAFDNALKTAIEREDPFALMHIDLDYFKTVNDTCGHAAGDAVLRATAEHLKKQTRSVDLIARTGGDEFMILLSGVTKAKDLEGMATRIIELLETPLMFGGEECRISGSIGIAMHDGSEAIDPEDLLHFADTALYVSKRGGRARATVFYPALEPLFPGSSRSGQAKTGVDEELDPPSTL